MEYKRTSLNVSPRLIIHGGAGNITPANLSPERYSAFRTSLLTIVSKTHSYMTTPQAAGKDGAMGGSLPSALDTAVHAVLQLEDDPLFNAGHGAVFTRDGVNELEASVMVSRGHAKCGVGVTGLRRVRNPILLARAMLEHGDADLAAPSPAAACTKRADNTGLDVPSAQGHTLIHGPTAEVLAQKYGVALVDPSYFFTRRRWDEHLRGLERESRSGGVEAATWSADEYLPQGTVGAVALDADGVVCVATSTGGLTNKLTGRIGDTPVPGAGFWAEEWVEEGDPTASGSACVPDIWEPWRQALLRPGPAVQLSRSLKAVLANCLPNPLSYAPLFPRDEDGAAASTTATVTTRSFAGSGTGNGDSFMRIDALRTVAAMARYKPVSSAAALRAVAGPGGELQRSAAGRWHVRGEGEGGIIGIELAVVRSSGGDGRVLELRSEVIHDHNCGGMFRAWIDESGKAVFKLFLEESEGGM